jgi:hypothetical protein
MSGWMVEQWIRLDLKGSDIGQTELMFRNLSGGAEENNQEPLSVKNWSVPVKILIKSRIEIYTNLRMLKNQYFTIRENLNTLHYAVCKRP